MNEKTELQLTLNHFHKIKTKEEIKQDERNVINFYARLKRFTKFYLALANMKQPYFITLTQNSKYNRDRSNLKRFIGSISQVTKFMKDPMIYVIEKHKDGSYHAHGITNEGGMKFIVYNYKAGFIYQEPAIGNIGNELKKYMCMKSEGKRGYYANKAARILTKERNTKQKLIKKMFERNGEITT